MCTRIKNITNQIVFKHLLDSTVKLIACLIAEKYCSHRFLCYAHKNTYIIYVHKYIMMTF